ncbi:MAG: hypothetical protein NE328_03330, partial [Lentisphaeraceae bacterium]|nr:hypothetical protein [Lentisphaeraceae bacterium]
MKYMLLTFILLSSALAVDFNKDIKPILSRKCFSCHGQQKQKGKLRLDIRKSALKVLNKNDNGDIPLLSRINHSDPEEIMPPKDEGSLSAQEKKLLEEWINIKAPYGTHWSFIPPSPVSAPDIKDEWLSNDIDKFILAGMKTSKLKPNPV